MRKRNHTQSEEEIDRIVIVQADDLTKWGRPVRVKLSKVVPVYLKPALLEKAKSFARKQRVPNYRSWLARVIEERILLEEKKHRSTMKN